jgi:hypothetical protein
MLSTPVLNWLQRQSNGSLAKALGRLAASDDGLSRLESEIAELRRSVAEATGGNNFGGKQS